MAMALPILPTPSNFVAVALVINRSRDGPRFVFHYPPHVLPARGRRTEVSGDAELGDDGDLFLERASRPSPLEAEAAGGALPNPADLSQWNQDDHLVTESGSQVVPWEHVAGFPTKDLESILTPARAYHKKLFQVSLDPLYCVSCPVYAPENGKWKKRRKAPKAKTASKDDVGTLQRDIDGAAKDAALARASDADPAEVQDIARPAGANAADEVEDKPSSMTMFNLVFILDPKKHEVKDLVATMYFHIIKKINKAYKYCQQRSDFVWKESKRILALKEKGREDKRKMSSLWNEILATSSLAASMLDIYDAISQNRIAALQLDTTEGPVTHSVQIPMPFHTPDLPQDGEDDLCGLWLTTANSFLEDDTLENPSFLDRNFALLLMEDEKKIIAELQNDPDEATESMVEFVRHCKPTLSFHQVGQQSSNVLTPTQVRKYAQHFIFWRRAIAIPPLHARDIYIVSPNCNLSKLPRAAAEWSRQFPLAPPLANLLTDLSIAPRPYKWFCPSKVHRPVYLTMLAWLMRGGWVTQLCTFAYVVVWPEIIYEVEYVLEAEEIARAKRAQGGGGGGGGGGGNDIPHREHSQRTGDDAKPPGSEPSQNAGRVAVPPTDRGEFRLVDPSDDEQSSPTSSSHVGSAASSNPSQQPTLAEQAAEKARLERIADKAARELAERATAHARKAQPTQTRHPSVNDAAHLAHLSPYIILDAKKSTGKESQYLSAIGRRLRGAGPAGTLGALNDVAARNRQVGGKDAPEGIKVAADWDERVADAWPLFWKYLNGRSALERIALQEDMKRKDVWNLLTAMSEYLLCIRHW